MKVEQTVLFATGNQQLQFASFLPVNAWFFLMQSGVCGCEKGYTEVMTTHGFLDYCTRTPGVDNNKKADVKTNSGRLKPGPSQAQDLFTEWTLRPVGPGTEMERSLMPLYCCSRITRFLSRPVLSVGLSLCSSKHYNFKESLLCILSEPTHLFL